MDKVSSTDRYKTVYSELNNINYSKQYKQYSNAEIARMFSNLVDVIPDDGYTGFYVNRLKELGADRFFELANKARAGSDTPQKLFCWMLKNNHLVN